MLSKRRGEEYAEWGEQIADGEEDAGEFKAGQYAIMASHGRKYEELYKDATNAIKDKYEANSFRLM